MTAERSAMVAPGEGEVVLRGGAGVVRKISSAATDGAFSVVEHPLEPGALAAPPHTHADVDEYSFAIEGDIGVLVGEETFKALPLDLIHPSAWRDCLKKVRGALDRGYPMVQDDQTRPSWFLLPI